MRKFKALAFDVGGSVFNWKDAVKEALEVVIAEQDIKIDVESFGMECIFLLAAQPGRISAVFTHYGVDKTTTAFCS